MVLPFYLVGWKDKLTNPSPVSPNGEKLKTPWNNIILENLSQPSARRETTLMPSPFGEGQTDTPITRLYLGEVPTHKPLSRLPQGGEA